MELPSKAATRESRPEPDRSTNSASGGQGRGVVEVGHLQKGGGSPRWRTRWRTLLTTATLLSQRAEPSPFWSRQCLETRIGRGLARIPRVLCGKVQCVADPARPALHGASWRHTGGVLVVRATPQFLALVRHRGGVGGPPLGPPIPPRCGEVALTKEIPADCFVTQHNPFIINKLSILRRCSTPHSIHRDDRDSLGSSRPCRDGWPQPNGDH